MSDSKPAETEYAPFEDIQDETPLNQKETGTLEHQRIETVLIKVNSTSRAFQLRTFALFCVFNFFTCLQNATFLFMFVLPKFFVRGGSGRGKSDQDAPASEYDACQTEHSVDIFFRSVTTEFGLFCDQSHTKQFVQSLTLLIASTVSIVFVFLQSQFGSKDLIAVCFATMVVPGFICVQFVDGLAAKTAGITMLWVFNDATFSLISVFCNELFVEPFRNLSNVVSRFVYFAGGIFGTWMTLHLRDYRLIVLLFSAGYVAFVVMLLACFPRSPSFLLKQKRNAELARTIRRIARVNGYPEQSLPGVMDSVASIIRRRL